MESWNCPERKHPPVSWIVGKLFRVASADVRGGDTVALETHLHELIHVFAYEHVGIHDHDALRGNGGGNREKSGVGSSALGWRRKLGTHVIFHEFEDSVSAEGEMQK